MASLTHQTINYVKGAGAGIEKRVIDKIKSIENYIHCCLAKEKETSFTLSANAAGTGNWQNIPASGISVIASPGPGNVNIITKVVININASVDITGGGAATVGNFGIFQVAGGNPLVGTTAPAAGVIVNRPQAPLNIGGAIADNALDSAIVIDHTTPGSDAAATAVGTAVIKIYYKTVQFSA